VNLHRDQLPIDNTQRKRNAIIVNTVFLLAFAAMGILYIFLALQTPVLQIYALAGLMTTVAIVAGIGLRLVRNEKLDLGIGLVVTLIIIALPLSSLLTRGLGIYLGVAQLAGISLILSIVVSRRPGYILGSINIISAILTSLLDVFGAPDRLDLPIAQVIISAVVALGLAVFVIIFIGGFRDFNLQAKITIGILFTGGLALGILSWFAFTRAGQLVGNLSDRFENQVNLLAEEQLRNIASTEANKANISFITTVSQVQSLANQLELLQEQKNTLGNGTYWNAGEKLIQFSDGQYTSTLSSPRSVFVPSYVRLDDNLIQELNTTAHLDFSAPFMLKSNLQIRAVYYTNLDGVITYYPNISLTANISHDYNATMQPTFRIASPLFNPNREPRWSFPRQDPAGVGMIVSVSVPVYMDEEFSGVMAADFRLNSIADDIKAIKVGDTGYAFLVDNDGHIIAMPQQGYELFDIVPEVLDVNEEPRQTISDGNIPFELQQITARMVVGGSGVVSTQANGEDIFIAYAPIAGNTFSLGMIVPRSELTRSVAAAEQEITRQIQSTLQNAIFILTALLLAAILVSLFIGQLIAAPIRRLTQTANQILEGELAAQAVVTTRDETGTLAQAFNAMTQRLRETLSGLEKMIDERTSELMTANEANQRRAKQFQSIAQVARTISSTLEFDRLLTQIATTISNEFGFYHVGVFLLDAAREYAVLSAANSEGGQIMLARGHRLKVGEKGLVGFVSSTARPRVALDTGADAVFFNNPDLPDTRSEIALPLRAGERVIGVLDVQSKEPNAFSQEDVTILSTLADQVSIAIQNSRQNEATQTALAEADALSMQFVQTGWEKFTKKQSVLGIRHTGAKSTILYSKKAKGKDEQPTGQLKIKGRGAILSLPIKLRGQVIGSVDVRAPDNRKWDQDELDIVTAIIERAAIAMENARLLDESQRRAAKERTIGEISARISAHSNVDELLKTAAQELNRTLPGTEIAIQFKKEETE